MNFITSPYEIPCFLEGFVSFFGGPWFYFRTQFKDVIALYLFHSFVPTARLIAHCEAFA